MMSNNQNLGRSYINIQDNSKSYLNVSQSQSAFKPQNEGNSNKPTIGGSSFTKNINKVFSNHNERSLPDLQRSQSPAGINRYRTVDQGPVLPNLNSMRPGTTGYSTNPRQLIGSAKTRNSVDVNQSAAVIPTYIRQEQANKNSLSTIDPSVGSSAQFGLEGYKLPKVGLPPRQPQYSMPKDKFVNFLRYVQKNGSSIPGPSQYHKDASWDSKSGNFGKGAQRKTFTDDAIKKSKLLPSSAQYNTEQRRKIRLGKLSKAETGDYLSEAQFLSVVNPSPTSYSPNKNFVMHRSSSYHIKKPIKDKKTWKFEKSTEPDPCSYDVSQQIYLTKKREPKITIPKSKNIKFSVAISESKKFIPSSANYTVEPCYELISRPYVKTRY